MIDAGKTHETKRLEYSHTNLNTPVRTTMRCYNSATGDCTTTLFNEPVSQLLVTTTLDTGISSQVLTKYTNAGLFPTEVDEYDFGATSPTRKTITTYAPLTNNISDKPATVTVYDSGGNIAKETSYTYDAVTPPPMSLPGHVTIASGSRGNATSVIQQINNSGTTLLTQYAYDDAGQVISVTDPKLNVTTYSYDAATDAYRTKITRPKTGTVSHVSTYGYGPNSGLMTSTYDENKQLTSYVFDSMYRESSVMFPDGGETTYSYSLSPTSKTTNRLLITGSWITSVEQLDGYGRQSETQLTTDPQGTTYTVTSYDSLGRKSSVYNPTRCNPPNTNCGESTWGVTGYQYDALNRTTGVMNPDGSAVTTSYTGNCNTVTDEVGNQRKTCSDALGRLTGVWEAPNLTSTYNYETDYTYDALNNLLSVNQKGGSTKSSNWRTRTFTYDWLSRLLCAANPEIQAVSCPTSATGTFPALATLYTYDNDGNVSAKTAPSPNQASAGTETVTTSYNYDALNRLIGKSYQDNYTANPETPGVAYSYDGVSLKGCTIAPPGNTDSYPVGRRTSMCDGSGATSWAHDSMGRVLKERRTIGTISGDYENDTFNLDGSVASVTSLGYKISYTYGGAARPLTAMNSTKQIVTAATYAPPGELAGMTLGSAGINVSNAYNNRLQPILLSAGVTGENPLFSECFDFHLGLAVTGPSPCSFSANTGGDNGNVYQIVNNRDNTRNQNFIYDPMNRIQQAYSSGAQWGETFGPTATAPGVAPTQSGFDAWGNLTNRSGVTGKSLFENLSVSAGTNNQLSGFGYDAAGNMTSNGSASYVYDDENRLIATAGYSYIYDGDGERVEKCTEGTTPGACATSATGTLYWRGLGSDPLAETDLSGNVQNNYIFFGGQRVARNDSAGAIHYYFSDHLGSHGVVENAAGTACEQDIDYYPYGGVEHDYCPSVTQDYKFTGKERDSESSLDYFGARHYASTMGRWMSPDLVNVTEDRVVNPANTLNKYVYGGNNPLKYVDPDGRDITYFYDQGGIAGHAILFAYNQATGDSAIESFGPEYHLPIAPGESMYEMSSFTSADDLRDKLTSLTIQTTPELAQQVIDYIRANPDPALWVYAGPNCSSQVWKILQKFKLAHKNSRLDGRPGNTPRNLWGNLIQQNNPFHQGLNPKNGVDYGNNRFDMFNLMWLSLPQSQPKATVTTTVTNCVTDDKGKKVCDTQ